MDSQRISEWIDQAKRGDIEARNCLLNHYFAALIRQARKHLQGAAGRLVEEQDVALSAFYSVCRGMEANKYPDFTHRGNLWGMLLFKVRTKALNWNKYEARRHPALPESGVHLLRLLDGHPEVRLAVNEQRGSHDLAGVGDR